ncbi:hypothetical protein [Achromobacter marplatensis]|uniref:Uncharacterized protein n=1 Tax=Achromobacter marplatensis TaxID=470868 RepID=A0AA42WE25_9BURK|nr:hypothetical protein [Achromobacter marplatensis]MDH2052561.1 hypothetical protein [Achromobacter marplatensis]
MTPTLSNRPAAFDPGEARLYLDCMEVQKEQLRALLAVLRDILDRPDTDPNVRTLLHIAETICEDHRYWYQMKECLSARPIKYGARPVTEAHQ